MALLVTTCPHCRAHNMTFSVVAEYFRSTTKTDRIVFGRCSGCSGPIAVQMKHRSLGHWDTKNIHEDLFRHADLATVAVWPEAHKNSAPNAVPEKVGRNFLEAADARSRGSWNAACGMYRRTMEIALKEFAPDVEAWKLEKRIDKLATEHRITPDIQKWAHELRLDGNEALHGDGDADQEMTDQMHHLTHFLLVYLYTLPADIEAVRERRANGGN